VVLFFSIKWSEKLEETHYLFKLAKWVTAPALDKMGIKGYKKLKQGSKCYLSISAKKFEVAKCKPFVM